VSTKPTPHICDVCGKPATQRAVDLLNVPNYATGFYEAAPFGPAKNGCDEHPVESETFEADGLLPLPERIV